MKTCQHCRYFIPGEKVAIGQESPGQCMFAPPVPFMVTTRTPLGDPIPAIVCGRPNVTPDDFCASFEAAGPKVKQFESLLPGPDNH